MYCTKDNNKNQVVNENISEMKQFLKIPNPFEGFINTDTIIKDDYIFFLGAVSLNKAELTCDKCGEKMHINDTTTITIKHVPMGNMKTYLKIDRLQFKCPHCRFTKLQKIDFKDEHHLITLQLKEYIKTLLATNNYNNKEIAYLSGVDRNIVKSIDKERLKILYVEKDEYGNTKLIKPEKQAKYLGIDEFKLHDGYKYATHIVDLDTGHILWIAEGKKKSVVYDFIEHVGYEWMENVVAVACDMNSDFEEAFKEKCPHLKIVYDYFHIVKNFNDKVVNAIRKDEQNRLIKEGKNDEAKRLKRTKYILSSSEETLKRKDKEAEEGKVLSRKSELFKKQEVTRKGGNQAKYYELVNNNELFLLIELIKEILQEAFRTDNEKEMIKLLFDIMEMCEQNANVHLNWFKKLIYNHFDGIITHATDRISTGKIEGINNKIKTLRRQAYGYPDDEYFFLKLFDMSRN